MTLRTGSSGSNVLDLQNKLKNLGYTIDTDSQYGTQTADVVKQFQRDYGLTEDGIAGTQTISKLNELSGGGSSGGSFTAAPVDEVTRAKQLLDEHLASKPGEFAWEQQGKLDEMTQAWMDREDFSWDMSRDPFWQNQKENYSALGKMAMEDTMGQAATMTGGYNNSYAQTVGQQAYNQYMQQLNGMIPEIYGMARDRYDAEGDKMLSEISLLDSKRQTAYAEHQNELANWSNWLSHLQQDAQYKEQWQHQLDREAIEDARYAASRSGGGKTGDDEVGGIMSVVDSVDKRILDNLDSLKDAGDLGALAMEIEDMYERGLITAEQGGALDSYYGTAEDRIGDPETYNTRRNITLFIERKGLDNLSDKERLRTILSAVNDEEITKTEAAAIFKKYGYDKMEWD